MYFGPNLKNFNVLLKKSDHRISARSIPTLTRNSISDTLYNYLIYYQLIHKSLCKIMVERWSESSSRAPTKIGGARRFLQSPNPRTTFTHYQGDVEFSFAHFAKQTQLSVANVQRDTDATVGICDGRGRHGGGECSLLFAKPQSHVVAITTHQTNSVAKPTRSPRVIGMPRHPPWGIWTQLLP